MKNYTFDNLRRNSNKLYNLTQKTVANSVEIQKFPYVTLPEQDGRLDRLSFDVYGTRDYVEEIMSLNGILNPLSVKNGDTVNLFKMDDLSQLQWNEPVKINKKVLSNPQMNTQQDPNRLSPTDNPGIKPVTLDTKAKKIKILNKLS